MNSLLNSRIAIFLASLAAGCIGWLASKGLITADQVAEATQQLTHHFEAIVGTIVALVIWLVGLIARNKFSGGNSGGGNKTTGSSGGGFPCVALFTAMALSMAGLALSSCSSFSPVVTPDCTGLQFTRERNGVTYTAAACLGNDGKVEKMVIGWVNEDAIKLRSTIYRDKRPVEVEYEKDGLWVKWTEGSGISLGATPPEVETAMENAVPLPVAAVK